MEFIDIKGDYRCIAIKKEFQQRTMARYTVIVEKTENQITIELYPM